MSCRAIGRPVEEYLMNHIIEVARRLNYDVLVGEFTPTSKNALVADFYPRLGYQSLTGTCDIKRYSVDVADFPTTPILRRAKGLIAVFAFSVDLASLRFWLVAKCSASNWAGPRLP